MSTVLKFSLCCAACNGTKIERISYVRTQVIQDVVSGRLAAKGKLEADLVLGGESFDSESDIGFMCRTCGDYKEDLTSLVKLGSVTEMKNEEDDDLAF